MENGQTTILLSSKGEDSTEISDELFALLQYIGHSEKQDERSEDRLIRRIKDRVESIKKDREWRARYMVFEELISMEKEKAIREEKQKRLKAEARAEEAKAREEEAKSRAKEEKAKRENAENEIKRLRALLDNK